MVRRIGLALLLAGLFAGLYPAVFGSPMTLEQRYRLKKYLGNTFAKLEGRDPVHVVLIGDGNIGAYSPDGKEFISGDALRGFAGVFLNKLASEFFYTGGIRFLNPPEGGNHKLNKFLGPEIRFENLAQPNSSVLQGLQRVKSDAFLNEPDLILVQYGCTDAIDHMSIFTYRRALHNLLQECAKNGTDVILLGPTPVNRGGGAMDWGASRPYVTAAQGMAKAHDVMFIDTGKFLARAGGAADPNADPMAGTALIGDKLKRLFFVPDRDSRINEIQHLNAKAHDDLGKSVFHELLHGPVASDFTAVGEAVFGEKGMVRVVISIRNQAGVTKSGILGALSVGGLRPVEPAQRYSIDPGKTQDLTFDYVRPVVGKSESRSDIVYPLEIDDESIRFPFLIEDGEKSEFLDLPLRVGPISINWKSQQFINITNQLKVEWEFVSGSDRPVNGTYRLSMGGGIDQPRPFNLSPLSRKRASTNLRFGAPQGVDCFQTDVTLEVEINGQPYRFGREIEASRDLALGEKVIMASSNYLNAAAGKSSVLRGNWSPTVHFDAVVNEEDPRKSGLYAVVDLNGLEIPDLGNNAAIRASLTIDGRSAGRARDFGAVSPLLVYFKGSGGNGYIPQIPIGAFGEGYNMSIPSSGISSWLKNNQIQIKVPQSYLDLHDWNIGGDSLMGVHLEVSVADPANPDMPFPLSRTFSTHSPKLMYKNEAIRSMARHDAQSLTTLRFSRQPVNSWSVRVY
ncbi:MAG: SGNH/GDSL hydrolase family protein [Verrucomicrobiales bacterium]|nr:SGNH/GDSL hydrolase family protein [Verrucomicrobiales bacterium]